MRTLSVLTVLTCIVFLGGCGAVSLNPLYTEKDLTLRPDLAGMWRTVEGTTTVTITLSDPEAKTYRGEVMTETTKPGKPARFAVRFVKLGEHVFLDAIPARDRDSGDLTLLDFNLIPVHSIAMVDAERDKGRVTWMNCDWIDKGIAEKRLDGIAAMRDPDDRVVITASTRDLQKFVLKHAADKEAFKDPVEFRRCIGHYP